METPLRPIANCTLHWRETRLNLWESPCDFFKRHPHFASPTRRRASERRRSGLGASCSSFPPPDSCPLSVTGRSGAKPGAEQGSLNTGRKAHSADSKAERGRAGHRDAAPYPAHTRPSGELTADGQVWSEPFVK